MTFDPCDKPVLLDRNPRLLVWARWFLAAGYSLRTVADLFDCDPHELNMGLKA